MLSMVYSVLVLYSMCTFLSQFRLISSLLYLRCAGYTEKTLCRLQGCDKLLFYCLNPCFALKNVQLMQLLLKRTLYLA